jgi:uncharacterized phage-associated protein
LNFKSSKGVIDVAAIIDVAKYILELRERETTMKLEKLAFYSQAYSLASCGKPLFEADFQAWANGPVAPELFKEHRGFFSITPDEISGNSDNLTVEEKKRIDYIVTEFGELTGNQLSRKTHNEKPWVEARGSLSPTARSQKVISKESIRSFYSRNPKTLGL